MNIEIQKTAPIMNIPKRNVIDVCFELNKLGFPFSHRDENSLFFIRPDMCLRRRDFEVILGTDGKQFSRWFQDPHQTDKDLSPRLIDEIIFFPTESDFFRELSGTLNQLTETNTSGWFAYTNVRDNNEQFIRGQGENPWFALADAWKVVQEWKLGGDKRDAALI